MIDKAARIGVCVCTIREREILSFLEAWIPRMSRINRSSSGRNVSLFVHEDHGTKEFDLPSFDDVAVTHTCHREIESTLGRQAWIIPRRTGAGRSFPMYLAWKAGCDFIITMDDDCYPQEKEERDFFETHLSAFEQDRWFRTIDGEHPRGIPYGDKGRLPVLLNHGLWTGVPDLDGPTALVRERWPVTITLRATREVIPPGMWFPLCAMNVCYHRSAIPAAYNLIMGLEEAGFDRFDDIWSGLFLKRIADHTGQYITSGLPFVRHAKASNYFVNLRKEALGMQLHEDFWKDIAAAPLEGAKTVTECYARMSDWVRQFPRRHPGAPAIKGYFEKLGEAMMLWAGLFTNSE
jgi:hypothetical protein